jgi:hypothetical protein
VLDVLETRNAERKEQDVVRFYIDGAKARGEDLHSSSLRSVSGKRIFDAYRALSTRSPARHH